MNVKHETISKKDTTTHKNRGDKTSEEGITLRQMYVEKNLDLKYYPYAYEHLTTDMKKKGIVDPHTSPKTRRPHKKSLLERSPKLKQKQKHDSDTSVESRLKFEHIDSDSADLYKFTSKRHISSKYTDIPEHFGQTVLNDDFEPEFRSKKKTISLKTLQPTHVIKWSTTTSSKSKVDLAESRSEYKMRSEKCGSHEDQELYTFKPGSPNVIELVKDIGYSIEIIKGKDLDLSDQNPNVKNSRYNRERYRKDSSRISRDHNKPVNIPSLRRQNRDSLKPKLKISKHQFKSHHFNSRHNDGRQQYRVHDAEFPVTSHEDLSIEEYGDVNDKKDYRRNNNPDTIVNDDSKVLGRIQHLENELNMVKIQIENDTNVKDLVSQVENGTESKTVNVDIIVTERNINSNDFSSGRPNIYQKAIAEQSPNFNQEVQAMESQYDVNRFQSKLNINNDLMFKTTNFSKQVSPFESNNANQESRHFPKSAIKKVSQLDTENKKTNDFSSFNTKSNKHIDQSYTETNINIKQKDTDLVKSSREKNSQSEDHVQKLLNDVAFKGRDFNERNENIHPKLNNSNEKSNAKDVKTELQPNSTKEIEQDQKTDHSGFTFIRTYDETTSMPQAKVELKANGKIYPTQVTSSDLLDSTATPSKLIKELTQEIGKELVRISNANVESKSETHTNRDAMNIHFVVNSGFNQSIINDSLSHNNNTTTE